MSEHTTGTTPPQESNPEWCIIAESVLGATHKRTGKPNQDAQASHPSADAVILALADGHGSEKYFRSHKGAKFAVATAVEQMRSFLTETAVQPNIASIERQATKLPRSIVERWVERVLADFQNTRFESEEEQKRYNKLRAEAGQQKELVPYGSTLLAIVVTQRFTFCLQLGDGDITFIKPHGEIVPAMAEDKRLLANETTSLCTPTAAEDFRLRFYPRKSTPPALVMLSTDGYVNSFSTQAGFHQVGVDILKQLYQDNGLEKVQAQLKGWLEEATRSGSGDDITVGFLCHLPTIRTRPAPIIKPPALADPPVVPTVPQPSPAGPMIKDNISSADAGNKQAAVTAAASPQFKKSHTPGPHPPRIEPSTKSHQR